jgi:hypothetical protein
MTRAVVFSCRRPLVHRDLFALGLRWRRSDRRGRRIEQTSSRIRHPDRHGALPRSGGCPRPLRERSRCVPTHSLSLRRPRRAGQPSTLIVQVPTCGSRVATDPWPSGPPALRLPRISRIQKGAPVVRCPVCTKVQLVYVQGSSGTSCYYCGARWFQSGDEQDGIVGLTAPPSALRSMGQSHATPKETR